MPNHKHPNQRDAETSALVTTSSDTQHFVTTSADTQHFFTTTTSNTHAHTTCGKRISHTQHLL